MEAHIDDVSLGTNTKEDHVLLLGEFFIVCQENHLRIKLEKCEFMKEEMEYLGFDVGYGWWKPAASKMQPLQDMQIRDDPKKGLHDVRSFVGACNFYRRHIHNFTYSSAPLTDLIKKTTPWRWTSREEECFQELKKKIASSNCLGVPRPEGEIVLITDASDVGGGGTIYQWQELNPAELTLCHYRTTGLNRDGSLKHDYPTSEWRLVPLGHWNWKWNQARSNYSTYDQELLAGMLVLLDSGHARQATVNCGRERQEGDRVAAGRRQGGDKKTTGQRQESGREATGSDMQATGRRQGRCDRRATGGRQGGDRVATGRRQGSDRKQDIATG